MFSIRGVPLYILSYSLLKGSVYGFMFWLPLYIKEQTVFRDRAGLILAMLDIGTIMGAFLVGFISDRLSAYARVVSPMLLLSAAYLFAIRYLLQGTQLWWYELLILLIGLCYGGPYTIICRQLTSFGHRHRPRQERAPQVAGLLDQLDHGGVRCIHRCSDPADRAPAAQRRPVPPFWGVLHCLLPGHHSPLGPRVSRKPKVNLS